MAFNINLALKTGDIQIVRNQPKWITFQPVDQDNVPIDCTQVVAYQWIVSHAQTNDPVDRLFLFNSDFVLNVDSMQRFLTLAEVNAFPLGAFLYELLISDDGFYFYSAYQGSISCFPSLLNQA